MKEFNFRAWDKKNKKMIYPPGPCDSNLGPYHATFDGRCYIEGVYQDLEYLPLTGLITKDADYIYEGDILGGQFEGLYISYCYDCRSFQLKDTSNCYACEGDVHWRELVEEDGKLEVIGNIKENEDLIV